MPSSVSPTPGTSPAQEMSPPAPPPPTSPRTSLSSRPARRTNRQVNHKCWYQEVEHEPPLQHQVERQQQVGAEQAPPQGQWGVGSLGPAAAAAVAAHNQVREQETTRTLTSTNQPSPGKSERKRNKVQEPTTNCLACLKIAQRDTASTGSPGPRKVSRFGWK